MYQAKGQGVTYKSICNGVFEAFGCEGMEFRDKSLPGHLKTGHDNVPPDVITAAREMSFENAIEAFEQNVTPLIADANVKSFIYAVKAVLREDDIPGDTLIGTVFVKRGVMLLRRKAHSRSSITQRTALMPIRVTVYTTIMGRSYIPERTLPPPYRFS